MTADQKLDAIIDELTYQRKLIEEIYQLSDSRAKSMSSKKKRMQEGISMLKGQLLNNPVLKTNPAINQTISSFLNIVEED